MKYIFIFILIVIGFTCKAQQPKLSLRPAILLISDTSAKDGKCYWVRGYDVGYYTNVQDPSSVDLVYSKDLIWLHVQYQDEKRKSIKGIVWISKPTQ